MPAVPPDQPSVEGAQRERFERAFRAHYPELLRFADARVDGDVARDAVSDTFLVAWRRVAEMPDPPRGGAQSRITAAGFPAAYPAVPRLENMFDTDGMSERRTGRGLPPRTDRQILANNDDVELLSAIGRGQIVVEPANRMSLRRLAREELCLAGFGTGVAATLLPRGQRIVAASRGELAAPLDD